MRFTPPRTTARIATRSMNRRRRRSRRCTNRSRRCAISITAEPAERRFRATKKPALPPAFLSSFNPPKSVRGFQRGLLRLRDGALDGRLHLLEGADLDLPHALARHAEFGGKVFQRHRLFRQTPRLEDA